ncbi:ARM repeat-containing protein [Phellopilus nigrolimitatus]|nr:ARM repeat-containing protein [Phellopilus nigrolimitatus]
MHFPDPTTPEKRPSELANEAQTTTTQNAAGIGFKNALSVCESTRQLDYSDRWLALPAESKDSPTTHGPKIIEILPRFMDSPDDASPKTASLQAIGYICESIKPEILTMRLAEILMALAAINTLYNSIEVVRDNFAREYGERNYIMQVVYDVTRSPSVPAQIGVFECLVRNSYYVLYGTRALSCVYGVFNIKWASVLDTNLNYLFTVEFWLTVREEEIELAIEAEEIIPVLLGLLTRQDGDADEDVWSVPMAAATCLALLAQTIAHASRADRSPVHRGEHQGRQLAPTRGSCDDVLAQFSMGRPTVLTPLNLLVKDTIAWTLGRIYDLLVFALRPDEHLHPLTSPRIVTDCCWAAYEPQLGSFYEEEGATLSSGPLAPYYEGIVTALLRVTDGTDNESNLRTSAYERWRPNLCSVLISVVRKLGDGIEPLADQILTVSLDLIQSSKTSTVLEDAFLVVGTMAAALEAHEDTQLCTVAIGVTGDISRALGEQSVYLSSETLNRNVKIPILSCFGDIALAIGPGFEPYLDHTMNVLRQAGSIMPNPMDYELVDYVSQLREGILEAYTGTVTGLKNTEKVQLLLPHVQSMLELAQRCLADEERPESVVRLSLGLVGDLADAFPNGEIKQLLLAEWLAQILRNGQARYGIKFVSWTENMQNAQKLDPRMGLTLLTNALLPR